MKVLSVAGDRVALLLTGEETGGLYTVMESLVPPGGGPPPHLHRAEDEGFQVVTGEVTFFLEGKPIVLQPGGHVFAPRGTPHHFRNTGAEPALVLITATPAGIEKFFEAAGTPLNDRGATPLPFSPAAAAEMIRIAPDYGIKILV